MKFTRPLITFAYLSDRFQETKGDIAQGFLPILSPLIKERSGKNFEPNELAQAVSQYFGIKIHPWVIEDWATRLQSVGYLEVASKSEEHVIYRYAKIEDELTNLSEKDVASLVDEFLSFANQRLRPLGIEINNSELEKHLLDRLVLPEFLNIIRKPDKPSSILSNKENIIRLKKTRELEAEEVAREEAARLDVLCADFILNLVETNTKLFDLLLRITNGALIAEVVLNFRDPGVHAELGGLRILLDAPLIMSLLGLANEEASDYANEFFQELQQAGARIETFKHCMVEIENNLKSALETYARENRAFGPTGSRLGNAAFRTYAISVRENVNAAVTSKGIKIIDDPRDPLYRFFTQEQEEDLREQIGYYDHFEAKARDAQSIGHVMRLRQGSVAKMGDIRGCKILFVTENARLAAKSTNYLEYKKFLNKRQIPPALSDRYTAGILWISSGGKGAELTRKRLLANCSAAVSPRQDVITRMHQFLSKVSPQQAEYFEALMTNRRAEHYLMSLTLADAKLVTEKNFSEIYDQVEKIAAAKVSAEKDLEREKAVRAVRGESEALVADLTKKTRQAELDAETERYQRFSVEKELEQIEVKIIRSAIKAAQTAELKAIKKILFAVALILFVFGVASYFLPIFFDKNIFALVIAGAVLVVCGVGIGMLQFWYMPEKLLRPLVLKQANTAFRLFLEENDGLRFVNKYEVDIFSGKVEKKSTKLMN